MTMKELEILPTWENLAHDEQRALINIAGSFGICGVDGNVTLLDENSARSCAFELFTIARGILQRRLTNEQQH